MKTGKSGTGHWRSIRLGASELRWRSLGVSIASQHRWRSLGVSIASQHSMEESGGEYC